MPKMWRVFYRKYKKNDLGKTVQKKNYTRGQIKKLFDRLLVDKSRESFQELREIIVSSHLYQPKDNLPQIMKFHFLNGNINEAINIYKSNYINLILSPSVHFCLSEIYELKDNEQMKNAEEYAGNILIQNLLNSAEGTKERPYRVLHVSDEYDILEHLNKEIASQDLIFENGRYYDCLKTKDNEIFWFDVSDMHRIQAESAQAKNAACHIESTHAGKMEEARKKKAINHVDNKKNRWKTLAKGFCIVAGFDLLMPYIFGMLSGLANLSNGIFVYFISPILAKIIAFIIIGAYTVENRYRKSFEIVFVYWLVNVPYFAFGGKSFSLSVVSLIIMVICMFIGTGISFLFKRSGGEKKPKKYYPFLKPGYIVALFFLALFVHATWSTMAGSF